MAGRSFYMLIWHKIHGRLICHLKLDLTLIDFLKGS